MKCFSATNPGDTKNRDNVGHTLKTLCGGIDGFVITKSWEEYICHTCDPVTWPVHLFWITSHILGPDDAKTMSKGPRLHAEGRAIEPQSPCGRKGDRAAELVQDGGWYSHRASVAGRVIESQGLCGRKGDRAAELMWDGGWYSHRAPVTGRVIELQSPWGGRMIEQAGLPSGAHPF